MSTIIFVAINISVKAIDGVDHQNTPEKHLHQIDAQKIFTITDKRTASRSYNLQSMAQNNGKIQYSLSGKALGLFLGLIESNENDWSALNLLSKITSFHEKLHGTYKLKPKA